MSPSPARKGFTLVELMIVIAIVGVLMAGTYVPYRQFSVAAEVRETSEKLAQSLVSAKAYASNGYALASGSGRTAADVAMLFSLTGGLVETWAVPHASTGSAAPATSSGVKIAGLELPKGLFLSFSGADALTLYWSAPDGRLTRFVDGLASSGATFSVSSDKTLAEDGDFRRSITVK